MDSCSQRNDKGENFSQRIIEHLQSIMIFKGEFISANILDAEGGNSCKKTYKHRNDELVGVKLLVANHKGINLRGLLFCSTASCEELIPKRLKPVEKTDRRKI